MSDLVIDDVVGYARVWDQIAVRVVTYVVQTFFHAINFTVATSELGSDKQESIFWASTLHDKPRSATYTKEKYYLICNIHKESTIFCLDCITLSRVYEKEKSYRFCRPAQELRVATMI